MRASEAFIERAFVEKTQRASVEKTERAFTENINTRCVLSVQRLLRAEGVDFETVRVPRSRENDVFMCWQYVVGGNAMFEAPLPIPK